MEWFASFWEFQGPKNNNNLLSYDLKPSFFRDSYGWVLFFFPYHHYPKISIDRSFGFISFPLFHQIYIFIVKILFFFLSYPVSFSPRKRVLHLYLIDCTRQHTLVDPYLPRGMFMGDHPGYHASCGLHMLITWQCLSRLTAIIETAVGLICIVLESTARKHTIYLIAQYIYILNYKTTSSSQGNIKKKWKPSSMRQCLRPRFDGSITWIFFKMNYV